MKIDITEEEVKAVEVLNNLPGISPDPKNQQALDIDYLVYLDEKTKILTITVSQR